MTAESTPDVSAEKPAQPSFTLDGQTIPFEPGDTIIRAAWRQGIEIPHYCWHPGLSVAANCRMCLVEVRSGRVMNLPIVRKDEATGEFVPATKPKLTPACQTPASEGAEVYAQSPEASGAHGDVQEMLLLNHPVDCPICDQAGECRLQDYWYENQHRLKRKLSQRVHKPKAVSFGEKIVYDAERCIMCTRCIRFCDEVVGDSVLDMRERGNQNEVVLAPGRTLDHDYALMTEHVCPVGALTSRDFRFKARVWFLKSKRSVCDGCATGCNTYADIDPRAGKLQRYRPRDNAEVNGHWMCDAGMLSHAKQHENRLLAPRATNTALLEAALASPAEALASWLREAPSLRLVASATHSNEDNAALLELAKALGHSEVGLAARETWQGDEILRDTDQNPNRAGVRALAETLGLTLVEDGALNTWLEGAARVLWLGEAGAESALRCVEAKAELLVLSAYANALTEEAALALPVANWLEQNGSFTNRKGLTQHFEAVLPACGGQPSAAQLVGAISQAWRAHAEVAS